MTLVVDALEVHTRVGADDALTGARELPNLARFLFQALGASRERDVKALRDVSFTVATGACLALVGEAGAGKTTLARVLSRLVKPHTGTITVDGKDALAPKHDAFVRRALQVVPADRGSAEHGALDPRRLVRSSLMDAARALHVRADDPALQTLLSRVQLGADVLDARAGVLPLGVRRRVAIARALLPDPHVLVCDAPTAQLDPVERETMLDVLATLRAPGGPALLLLTHETAAAAQLADTIGVLRRGRLVELAAKGTLLAEPQHPHTRALVAAAHAQRRYGVEA